MSLDDVELPKIRPKDYTSGYDRVSHVLSELSNIGVRPRSPTYSFVLCPFHSEKTPSGRVSHNPLFQSSAGSFRCYGCGAKATWSELAPLLNLEPFPDAAPDPEREVFIPSNISGRFDAFKESAEPEFELLPLTDSSCLREADLGGVWRNFQLDWLDECLSAKFCRWKGRLFIYLPVTVSGVERGHIKAQLRKPEDKSIPSYFNAPGRWSLNHGLFPYDYAVTLMREKSLTTIVLVEGPRDALRLLTKGIPAVCILGTHSWTENKVRLLEISEATRIVLCFDGDHAGELASDLILSGKNNSNPPLQVARPLRSVFSRVSRVNLSHFGEDYDPGNIPWKLLAPIMDRLVL